MPRKTAKKTVALSANTAWFLYHFHKELAQELLKRGHCVHIITPYNKQYVNKLLAMGCTHGHIHMSRNGVNPVVELITIVQYCYLLYKLGPNTLLTFTIKPVIYGGLVAQLLKINTTSTITGLGTAFMKKGFLQNLAKYLYKIALKQSQRVFILNQDDAKLFIKHKLITKPQLKLLSGAGVNLDKFKYSPIQDSQQTIFIFIGRLLKDKGLVEYLDAAGFVNKRCKLVTFYILGDYDKDNLSCISKDELSTLCTQRGVKYLGSTTDVAPHIKQSTCVVLPSYREGTPTVLLEAMAIGRPIITTDAPGCRDVIRDNFNGYEVTPKDAPKLSEAMLLIINKNVIELNKMGLNGHNMVKGSYNREEVTKAYINSLTKDTN